MKTLTIENLTRAELLKLVQSRLFLVSPGDLLWAQWEAGCDEIERLARAHMVAVKAAHTAFDAWHGSTQSQKSLKQQGRLMIALQEARDIEKAAGRRYDAARSRNDRIYEAQRVAREAEHAR